MTICCRTFVNNISALIVENIILQDFSPAPNPATDHVEIGYALKRKAELFIDIFNWQDQTVNNKYPGIQDAAYFVRKNDDVIALLTDLYLISINANS